jgi:hypothetical protein
VAVEYFGERIAVNLRRRFFAAQVVTPGTREKGGGSIVIKEQQCLKSLIEPSDVSRMASGLAAKDSRTCSSQTLVVEGGWSEPGCGRGDGGYAAAASIISTSSMNEPSRSMAKCALVSADAAC